MTAFPRTPAGLCDLPEPATTTRWPWLSRCVADPEDFLASYWATRPYSEAGAGSRFAGVFTLEELDQLLATGAIRNTNGRPLRVRMFQHSKRMPPAAFSMAAEAEDEPSIDCERVAGLMRMGGTIAVRGVDKAASGLFELCGGLENELAHRVHANVYLTPPRTHGLNPHYDPHDVIILQISGRKHWKVFDRVPGAPGSSGSVDLEPDTRPAAETVLTPGDVLYIPRGWVHVADTADDISLHVTVGITLASVRDVLSHALGHPAVRARLDRPLPAGFTADVLPLAPDLADASQALAAALSDPDTARTIAADFARLWYHKQQRNTPGLIAAAVEDLRHK
jgi:bifunctional lysine-specific demethylase and histidyl-hydroxylase NO66